MALAPTRHGTLAVAWIVTAAMIALNLTLIVLLTL